MGLKLVRDLLEKAGITSPTWAEELDFLYKLVGCRIGRIPDAKILELGTALGSSAICMAQAVKDVAGSATIITVEKDPKLCQRAEEAIKKVSLESYIEVICYDDVAYLEQVESESLNALYSDSWHVHSHVKSELDLAIDRVVKYGYIGGHDYWPGEYGVMQAVDEWRKVNASKLIGWMTYCRLWWTVKC